MLGTVWCAHDSFAECVDFRSFQVLCEAVCKHLVRRCVLQDDLVALHSLSHEEVVDVDVLRPLTVDGVLGNLDARLVVLVDGDGPLSEADLTQ